MNGKMLLVALSMPLLALAAPLEKPIYTVPHELDVLIKYGHIQGATCSKEAIYLSHAGGIFKIDWKDGHLLKSCEAPNHLGDIAYANGRIYGAYGLRKLSPGQSPCMVGVWDQDLNPITEKRVDFPRSSGFDGALVLGDTLYVGVDHYASGRQVCPPHRDCTVMLFSVPDLKIKGSRDVVFDYPILYGVQTLATDGEQLLFGNYGGSVDQGNTGKFNCSRVTRDFKVIDNQRFHASEGFGLVPKEIAQREKPVFFNVNALGGNMQGWRKDPANNPPRIRIDFHEYDRKTGRFTRISKP